RTHGSALFTRGETQALVTATLGTGQDEQIIDAMEGEYRENFLLHYNFPPFATGESRAQRGPGRREIGHGALARRALAAVLPRREELPWVVRVVSDILSSNGSSSMATVCGGSLALMDAGVPIAAPVAGVAMGLVREGGADTVLTDITGAEDGAGDMDLKVAGTRDGLTAVQLDNKLGAIPLATLVTALAEARRALLVILGKMDEVLAAPREQVAANAPQIGQIHVAKRHVGRIIGPGGKRVNEIQSQTRSRIDIKDSGRIRVSAKSAEDLALALQILRDEATDLKKGEIYDAEVVTVKEYGAFVRVGAHEGLVHVSELEEGRTDKVSDIAKVGDTMRVKVLGADNRGRLELSRRAALEG
ncbi:MAG: polyribonucleotide nucleotidyltransferase, partial [Myxococcales bacterium]|nr:polyribonucleotide nucleotidyltransferase [Myxococcales bacterium]